MIMKTYREFNEMDWQRVAQNWRDWWAGALDRPLVVVEAIDFETGQQGGADPRSKSLKVRDLDGFITQFPLSTPVDEILDHLEFNLGRIHYYLDAFPKWWPNFGPGVMAGFLGSRVEYRPGTTWFHEVRVERLTDLGLRFDNENVWWRRAVALTEGAVARWGETVTIGHTDLGGNLDILASLRGTEALLLDLLDVPEVVDQYVDEITTLWIRYYEELFSTVKKSHRGVACWAPCWQPTRGYMLQSDFSYMISPKMFERWVLPDLTRCCEFLDYGFYHLDGPGQLRHVDALLSIPNLRWDSMDPRCRIATTRRMARSYQRNIRCREALPGLCDPCRRSEIAGRIRLSRVGNRGARRQWRAESFCAGS